jgi:hypothetical protein
MLLPNPGFPETLQYVTIVSQYCETHIYHVGPHIARGGIFKLKIMLVLANFPSLMMLDVIWLYVIESICNTGMWA